MRIVIPDFDLVRLKRAPVRMWLLCIAMCLVATHVYAQAKERAGQTPGIAELATAFVIFATSVVGLLHGWMRKRERTLPKLGPAIKAAEERERRMSNVEKELGAVQARMFTLENSQRDIVQLIADARVESATHIAELKAEASRAFDEQTKILTQQNTAILTFLQALNTRINRLDGSQDLPQPAGPRGIVG